MQENTTSNSNLNSNPHKIQIVFPTFSKVIPTKFPNFFVSCCIPAPKVPRKSHEKKSFSQIVPKAPPETTQNLPYLPDRVMYYQKTI